MAGTSDFWSGRKKEAETSNNMAQRNITKAKAMCSGLNGGMSIRTIDESWADAAEFVPGKRYLPRVTSSYSNVLKKSTPAENNTSQNSNTLLCPYYMVGNCRYGDKCLYIHGTMCDMCGLNILHPTDVSQQAKHKEECLADHEEDMKESFSIAQSSEITCGICMEQVWQKGQRKFGILENCNHAFCLNCIRKWRCAKNFNNTVVKACPQCRVPSSFVTPSETWVEDPEEKKKLIAGYKKHLSSKPCKHFNEGKGKCPFGVNCFYRHAYPNGELQDRTKIPKRVRNANGENEIYESALLWDFFLDRDSIELDFDDDLDFCDIVYLLGQDSSLDEEDGDDHLDWFFGDLL